VRKGIVVGVLGTLLVGGGAAGLVIWSGLVDVAATASNPLDPVLAYAADQSIRHHAPKEQNRLTDDPAALKVGLEHYREMCITCHAGPGVEAAEFAAGLHPSPPDLASADSQEFSDGMLYRTIAKGIGSTGMPGIESTHTPAQIWAIVAFVRHLPKLSADEKKELAAKPEETEEHAEAPSPAAEAKAGEGKAGPAQTVSMVGFKFVPAKLEVHVGDAVEWINRDFVPHTATADDKTFDTGKLEAGASKRVVMTKAGTFPYTCHFHSGMKGTLVVE
jgi:plastocyanin